MYVRWLSWLHWVPVLALLVVAGGCAGAPKNPGMQSRCDRDVAAAYEELKKTKAQGFDGSVKYTKAAGLLGAAKIQQEFGKFPNCVDKVKRARYYLKASLKE